MVRGSIVTFEAVLLAMIVVAAGCQPNQNEAEVRTTVAEVGSALEEEGGDQPGDSVRIEGVVTYEDPSWGWLFVADETGGMFINLDQPSLEDEELPPLSAGERVEVRGGVAPSSIGIDSLQVRRLGPGTFPAPDTFSISGLRQNRPLSHWVQVRGVVRTAEMQNQRLVLTLAEDGQEFRVTVQRPGSLDPASFVGTTVQVRGICVPSSGVPGGIEMYVPNGEQPAIQVPRHEAPVRTIGSTLGPDVPPESTRVRVRGTVDQMTGGALLVVRDSTGSIRVQAREPSPVSSGDAVDVVGFLSTASGRTHLRGATVQPDTAAGETQPAPEQTDRALSTLTAVQEIRGLSPADAQRDVPVRLEGVVTYADPSWGLLFVQDETAGIYVELDSIPDGLQHGHRVVVEGTTMPGQYAPSVRGERIQILELGSLPPDPDRPARYFLSGQGDAQWVGISGTVQDLRQTPGGQHFLKIDTGVEQFEAQIPPRGTSAGRPDRLIGADVRVHGVGGTLYNDEDQLVGVKMFVPSWEEVDIREPGPADLFSVPLRSISSLLSFSAGNESNRLVRVRGRVTHREEQGNFHLQGEDGAVRVNRQEPADVEVGDLVEVVGFEVADAYEPRLEDAEYRVLEDGESPMPLVVTADDALSGRYADRLVQMDAELIDRVALSGRQEFTFQAGDHVFNAILEESDLPDRFSNLRAGSRVRVTGVYELQVDQSGGAVTPRFFELQLRSPADLTIVEPAPWWNWRHTVGLLGLMVLLVLGAVAWGVALRRTVRKQTDLIRSREKVLQALINNIPHAIYVKDPESRFILTNEYAAQLMGCDDPDDLIGKTDFDFFPDEYASKYYADEREIVETGEPKMGIEEKVVDPSGQERWALATKVPILDEEGEVDRIVGITYDITERKEMEEELRKARAEAMQASQAKSQFLANMSHEIRTPMNGILGMIELVLDTSLSKEQQEYLSMAETSAHSLLSIINDVLDFSKIEAEKLSLEWTEFAFSEKVTTTLKTLAIRAHRKGLELAVDVDPEVPDRVVGDPTRLSQVLVNLVGNAIKFTEDGEVVVTVERLEDWAGSRNGVPMQEASEGSDMDIDDPVELHVTVRDTGIGIPEEKQKKIFEAFEQADMSTTRSHGGTGLGLVISSRLVRLMGGEIWLDSTPGEGSTFHFTLRLGHGEEQQGTCVPDRLQGMEVMVVDDNATNRHLLARRLERWGMTPVIAPEGEAALAQMEDRSSSGAVPPLVLLDEQMPGLGGIETAARLRERWGPDEVSIVLLTSMTQAETERREELGINERLIKPFTQRELLERIEAVLGEAVSEDGTPEEASTNGTVEQEGLHVLLAEDNTVNQKFAVQLLKKEGHEVEVVENGLEATEAVKDGAYDLVLMDVQMPELSGVEATRRIRAWEDETGRERVPIVALTARATEADEAEGLEAGMDGYLSKPVQSDQLGDMLSKISSMSAEEER